jgi:hypothetical protein
MFIYTVWWKVSMTPEQKKLVSETFKSAEALLWTLEQGAAEAWPAPLKEAWIACHRLLAGVMQEAAAAQAAAPHPAPDRRLETQSTWRC